MFFSYRLSRFFAVCILLTITGVINAAAADQINRSDLERLFAENAVTGTFALLDVTENRLQLVNPERAQQRFFPASTFKIANSLIALEVGVVSDENEIIPFGGKPQPFKSWERDMSMRDAIKISNVPVYVELARRIGLDRYGDWLKRLGYGNQQTGGEMGPFWLIGPLAISPIEQAGFLAQLATSTLPAASGSQDITRDIVRQKMCDGASLHAKSGWSTATDPQIGWWVGWVERGSNIHAFALNIDVNARRDVNFREPLAMALLEELGVWKDC